MTKKAMRIIGVTGGVGAGKSTVLSILQNEYGAMGDRDGRGGEGVNGAGNHPALKRSAGPSERESFFRREALTGKSWRRRCFATKRRLSVFRPSSIRRCEKRWRRGLRPPKGRALLLRCWSRPFFWRRAIKASAPRSGMCGRTGKPGSGGFRRAAATPGKKSLSVMENQKSEEEFMKEADVVVDNSGGLSQLKERIAGILHL